MLVKKKTLKGCRWTFWSRQGSGGSIHIPNLLFAVCGMKRGVASSSITLGRRGTQPGPGVGSPVGSQQTSGSIGNTVPLSTPSVSQQGQRFQIFNAKPNRPPGSTSAPPVRLCSLFLRAHPERSIMGARTGTFDMLAALSRSLSSTSGPHVCGDAPTPQTKAPTKQSKHHFLLQSQLVETASSAPRSLPPPRLSIRNRIHSLHSGI